MINIPSNKELLLRTKRTILEPTVKDHSIEIIRLFQDSSLFQFIPLSPRSDLIELENIYELRSAKQSPNKKEIWLNWIGRLSSNDIFGEFEATIFEDLHVSIAYMVDTRFEGQGLGFEAMECICNYLQSLNISYLCAYIDTRNLKSINLIKKLGFIQMYIHKNADEFKGSISDEFYFVKRL